jgi:hypothetical protein
LGKRQRGKQGENNRQHIVSHSETSQK